MFHIAEEFLDRYGVGGGVGGAIGYGAAEEVDPTMELERVGVGLRSRLKEKFIRKSQHERGRDANMNMAGE